MGVGRAELGARRQTDISSWCKGRRWTNFERDLRRMNQGSLAGWTLVHPFAEGHCYHQPSSLLPPVRFTVAPLFSVRFLLHFCFFLQVSVRPYFLSPCPIYLFLLFLPIFPNLHHQRSGNFDGKAHPLFWSFWGCGEVERLEGTGKEQSWIGKFCLHHIND